MKPFRDNHVCLPRAFACAWGDESVGAIQRQRGMQARTSHGSDGPVRLREDILAFYNWWQTCKTHEYIRKSVIQWPPLSHQVKRNIGYVLQDDLLFDALTVEETLLYTARLRMSKDIPLCVPQLSFVVRSICYASSQLHVCLMYLCTMHTSKVRQVPSQRQV
jgi:hypothetical protein